MRRIFLHIPAVLAALLLCFACSDDKSKVIPRGKMAKIYAEMLMMDQWAMSDSRLRQEADTSLIYEPIFEKYGYDGEDYRQSVTYYMEDPERFSRIFRATSELLDARMEELMEQQKKMIRQEEILRFVTDFEIGKYYPYLSSEPYVHYYDSLSVELDTLSTYRLVSIERADTLFDCLRMIVPGDTLAVEAVEPEDEPVDKKEEKPVVRSEQEVIKTKTPVKELMTPKDIREVSKTLIHRKSDTLKLN